MKYTIYIVGLVLLLAPMFTGCETKPEDKWPVIASWTETAALDVAVKIDKKTGLPTVTWPASTAINLVIDVRTYNASQAFKVTIIAESVHRDYLLPFGTPGEFYPFFWSQGDPTLPTFKDHIAGTYVANSGNPPQGISEITLAYFPMFPFSLSDWYYQIGPTQYVINRYSWSFLAIVEDAGGRTDTFRFTAASNLKITIG